jgi:hypothetical protein
MSAEIILVDGIADNQSQAASEIYQSLALQATWWLIDRPDQLPKGAQGFRLRCAALSNSPSSLC